MQNKKDLLNSKVNNRILDISAYAKQTILGLIVRCKTDKLFFNLLVDPVLARAGSNDPVNVPSYLYLYLEYLFYTSVNFSHNIIFISSIIFKIL